MQKKDLGLLVLILVVGAIVAYFNHLFLSPVNIANTANLVGLFGIFAMGQALVIMTGGIELSSGSVIALTGVIFVDLIANKGVPWPAAAMLVLIIGLAMGFVHGLLITKVKLQPFVVTLCGLLIYRGIARFYTKDATAGFPFGVNFPDLEWLATGRTDPIELITGGAAHLLPIPHSFFLMLVIAVVMWFVLHRSVFGRYLFAIGKNEEAARYSGIRTHRVIVSAYVICGLLTALSSIFFAMYTRSILPSGHGNFYELYAIAAAVLGGFSLRGGEGSIIGVILGTVLLQVLQNLVNMLRIPSSLNFAVMGSVILIGVIADQLLSDLRERRRVAEAARQTGRPEAVPAE
jgi:ribose transport system permease protein